MCISYRTPGRLVDRLCTDGELRSYFATDPRRSPPENVNCNADSYLVACNPGFASSLDSAAATKNYTVPPKYPQDIPRRFDDYAPCCPGFFCPKGLACMIREWLRLLLCHGGSGRKGSPSDCVRFCFAAVQSRNRREVEDANMDVGFRVRHGPHGQSGSRVLTS